MFIIALKHITPRRTLYRARIVLESCSNRNCNRPIRRLYPRLSVHLTNDHSPKRRFVLLTSSISCTVRVIFLAQLSGSAVCFTIPHQVFFMHNLHRQARPDKTVSSASRLRRRIGFSTIQDCCRQEIWNLNTFRAIIVHCLVFVMVLSRIKWNEIKLAHTADVDATDAFSSDMAGGVNWVLV